LRSSATLAGSPRPTSPASARFSISIAACARARRRSASSPRSPSSSATSTERRPGRRRSSSKPSRLRRWLTDPLPGTEPVALTPPSQPITGDSHHHLIAPLIAHAAALGYNVEIRGLPADGPGGWCDPKRKHIVVAAGPANRQLRTLVHEIAHAHGLGYAEYGRERCEVLVDCVTYCVLGSVGLDVAGESIPYIAGWGEDGALEAIREYAQTIDTIARCIEDALASQGDPSSDSTVSEAVAA
jgi:hypothetical protein